MCLRVRSHLEKKLPRVSRHRTQGAYARACTKTGRLSGNSKGDIALSMSFFVPVFQRFLFHHVLGAIFRTVAPFHLQGVWRFIPLCSVISILRWFSV
jgi:hypothetical protein